LVTTRSPIWVLAHARDGFGPEHLIAVAAALVENHLGELDVVAGGAVKAAAAHVEFRILFKFKRDGRK